MVALRGTREAMTVRRGEPAGRREFLTASLLAAGAVPRVGADSASFSGKITDVEGVRAGHYTDKRRPTGCTVLIFDRGAAAGVDVRGSAPGTRETDLLNPLNTVQRVNAIVLSGGSAYGLATAHGVVRYLEERHQGYAVDNVVVPIVPAAILYDLSMGDASIRPDADAGYQACLAATSGAVAEGNVGAGAGALVGQMFGHKRAMKSGLGTASVRIPGTGLVVGAIVAVNAAGDVRDPRSGAILAGARTADGKGFADTMAQILKGYRIDARPGTHTTIGVVATNAKCSKAEATKIAQMAHDGLARAINPVHTPNDGDALFAACTGTSQDSANVGALGAIAAEVVSYGVVRAVQMATGILGVPAMRDLGTFVA
jgi:L-aminopeptidase/D-esterase-like protein